MSKRMSAEIKFRNSLPKSEEAPTPSLVIDQPTHRSENKDTLNEPTTPEVLPQGQFPRFPRFPSPEQYFDAASEELLILLSDIFEYVNTLRKAFGEKAIPTAVAIGVFIIILHNTRETAQGSSTGIPNFPTPDFSNQALPDKLALQAYSPISGAPSPDMRKLPKSIGKDQLVLLDSPDLNWEVDVTHDIIIQVRPDETVTSKIQVRYSLDWKADPNLRNAILLQLRQDNPSINIDRVKPEERVKISAKVRSLIKELLKKKSK